MATTTATITLSSSDLLSDNLSLSATMNLYQHGTTATGLEQLNYHRALIPTGTNFDLIPESAALNANPANYAYIINKNRIRNVISRHESGLFSYGGALHTYQR